MRIQALSRACALLAVLSWAPAAWSQQLTATGSITTAGADCSVATRCFGLNVDGVPSIGLDIDVGTSATLAVEVSQTATSVFDDSATARWKAPPNGDDEVTADGAHYYGNQGFRWMRVRAIAILGATTVAPIRGLVSSTVTGDIDIATTGLATEAKQDTLITATDGLEGGLGAAADAAATAGSTGSVSAKARLMTSQLDAIQTSAGLLDNAISGAGFNITQEAGVAISLNAGAVDAGTRRMTLSSEQQTILSSIESATGNTVTRLDTLLAGLAEDCADGSTFACTGPATMLRFDAVSPATVTEGQASSWRGTATGEALMALYDAAGNNRGANVNASNQLLVLDGNSAAALTALQLIDNPVLVDEANVWTDATSSVGMAGFVARSSLDTLVTGRPGAANMTLSRNLMVANVPDSSALSASSSCHVGSGTGSTAATNATNCAAAAANYYGGWFVNTSTTIGYVRFYNLASAPTCSSATGFVNSVPIPPASAAGQAGGIVYIDALPVNFTTGIGFCITGGGSSTDNTNGPAGIYGAVRYKS